MAQARAATQPQFDPIATVEVLDVRYVGGTGVANEATVVLAINGERRVFTDHGVGTIDAAFKALLPLNPDAEVIDYRVKAAGKGASARAVATVVLKCGGSVSKGQGTDPNTIVASVKAYVAALCKFNR